MELSECGHQMDKPEISKEEGHSVASAVASQIGNDFDLIKEIWKMKGYHVEIDGDFKISVERLDTVPPQNLN